MVIAPEPTMIDKGIDGILTYEGDRQGKNIFNTVFRFSFANLWYGLICLILECPSEKLSICNCW
jgi:hypothetical protein